MKLLTRLFGGDVDPLARERRATVREGRLYATNHGTRRDLIDAKDEALARAAMAEAEVRHLSAALDAANEQLRTAPAPDAADMADRYRRLVQVIVEHEQLPDDSCRCRWGADTLLDPEIGDAPIWHAEHLARQLAPLLRAHSAPRPTPRTGSLAVVRTARHHLTEGSEL